MWTKNNIMAAEETGGSSVPLSSPCPSAWLNGHLYPPQLLYK